MRIVLIGAGNVATHVGSRLKSSGVELIQLYSHSIQSAQALGSLLEIPFTNTLKKVVTDADVYIYMLKDSVLQEVSTQIDARNALHIHTAGAVSIDIFKGKKKNYGVLYPLQTFSKTKAVNFDEIPLFMEANNEFSLNILEKVAYSLSSNVYILSSEKRKYLHLSAVFSCNFTNYMYLLAGKLVNKAGLDYNILLPLIEETARKLKSLTPYEAQTGPAVRDDKNVIYSHLELLKNDEKLSEIYKLLSESITAEFNNVSFG